MNSNQFDQFVEEQITVLTEGERIDGLVYHVGGARLSDFLNSSIQQEASFLKVKDAAVTCRRSGYSLAQVPFLMVARDKIVMVLTYTPGGEAPAKPIIEKLAAAEPVNWSRR